MASSSTPSNSKWLWEKFWNLAQSQGYKVRRTAHEQADLDAFTSAYPKSTLETFVDWVFESSPPRSKTITTSFLHLKWPEFTKVFSV